MHVRDATAADIPAIADIATRCFITGDELYEYTNPYRHQYPVDFRNSFLQRLRLRFWSPYIVIQVAVLDEGDPGPEGPPDGSATGGGNEQEEDEQEEGKKAGSGQRTQKSRQEREASRPKGETVIGYSLWERFGEDEGAKKWKWKGWNGYIELILLNLQAHYDSIFSTDRSLDPHRLSTWMAAAGEELDTNTIPAFWKLRNLCTDPAFQRRGVGGRLMSWGKERAIEENIPIGLSSSLMGQGLYLKEGFRRFATIKVEGFPREVETVPVFLWEPPGMEGKWGLGPGEKKVDVEMNEGNLI